MKRFVSVLLFLLVSSPLWSQAKHTKEEAVEHFCHAPEVTSGPEFEELKRVLARLGPIVKRDQTHQIHVALVDSGVINAWENKLTPTQSLICVPTALVRFMGDGDGEFAFILSHEVGHALDDVCKSAAGRMSVTKPTLSGSLNQLLGGPEKPAGRTKDLRSEGGRDWIPYLPDGGLNPFDAAGAFGRLEMYLGDTSTGVLARLTAIGNSHPITPDRIRHMRTLLMQLAQPR